MRSLTAAALLLTAVAAQSSGPINSLPGWSGSAAMSSGYLTVDADRGRQLFHWFVAAENGNSSTPLVVWFNGGPGCSSLSGGLFSGFETGDNNAHAIS